MDRPVLAALLLCMCLLPACCMALTVDGPSYAQAANDLHRRARGLIAAHLKAGQPQVSAPATLRNMLAAERRGLTPYAANEYTKCIYNSADDCVLNPLYLATAEFGQQPKNALQELMLGYAYQSKQCAAQNGNKAACNALSYCEYFTTADDGVDTPDDDSYCQYTGAGASSGASFAPACTDAKINLDAADLEGVCDEEDVQADCTAIKGCKWSGTACAADAGDAAALEAFMKYVLGSGDWQDSWFGKCATGKALKEIFTMCHGTDSSKCDTKKCTFTPATAATPAFCEYSEAAGYEIVYGNNDFTKKYVAASDACSKLTEADCEDAKGPAATVDLSQYSDTAKLESAARDKGSAGMIMRSASMTALAALMAVGLFAVMLA